MEIKETAYDRLVQATSKDAYENQELLTKVYKNFGPAKKKFAELLRKWRKKIKEYPMPPYTLVSNVWITFAYKGKCYQIDSLDLKTTLPVFSSAGEDIVEDLKKIDGVTVAEIFILYD